MQQLVTPRDVNPQTNHYKTIFLSDIHLGSRACQADLFLDFLKYNDGEKIYLVGDIVDGWRLKRNWYWLALQSAQRNNDVPGNRGVNARSCDTYKAVNGKNYLVMHGDAFDNVVLHARWLAYVGDHAYDAVLALNTFMNGVRR